MAPTQPGGEGGEPRPATSDEQDPADADPAPPVAGYVETRGPPSFDAAFAVINPIVTGILRSPIHGLLSDSLLVLTFSGRKSGTEYSTPVGYWREDGTLLVTTHSPWWRNLRGGEPVTVVLQGRERSGVATPHEDPATVARYMQRFIETRGVEAARRIGLSIDGDREPTLAELEAGVEGTVVIEIELGGSA